MIEDYRKFISHPTETIEKEGRLNRFSGKTKCKDMRSWITMWIGQHSKRGNLDMVFVFQEVLKAYNYFEPEKVVEVDAKQWKGKSSIEVLKEIDRLIITKYQKETPESEPKEIRTEVSKEELGALIYSIKIMTGNNPTIEVPTNKLAHTYCNKLGYAEGLATDFWKEFFNNRSLHNKFTIMLNGLQELGFIEYKGGKTRLLNKDISVQLLLDN
jgi:hypothetical protein